MKLYIIDTCRMHQWKAAFPSSDETETVFAHLQPGDCTPIFSEIDWVFAHTHVGLNERNPDFPLTEWYNDYDHSKEIQRFVKQLKDAPVDYRPRVVLYSGSNLVAADRTLWEETAVAKSGPLEGYPASRVKCLNVAIGRDIQANVLRQIVEVKINNFSSDETQNQIEVPLALRLLCEAKQACGENKSAKLNGVEIFSPCSEEDWLKPFGIDATKESVCELMGDAKGRCEAVFNALKDGDEAEIATAVGNFLDSNQQTEPVE